MRAPSDQRYDTLFLSNYATINVLEVETMLRRAGKGYVLDVNGSHPFNSDRTSESDALLL